MSDFDLFMSDWLGDTLGVVLLFNFVLVGPASFAAGHGVAITWRPLRRLVLYTALISMGVSVGILWTPTVARAGGMPREKYCAQTLFMAS